MKKELPLAISPINGLQYIANPLTIILNDDDAWAWFFSDYVQLIWYKKEKLLSFYNKYVNEIPTCIPGLEFQCLDKKFAINNLNIIQFIIDSIDGGWYVFSSYDEQYIPNTYGYSKNKSWYHDFMLHGYDLDKKELFFTVYTQRGKYERNVVKIEDFMKGFLNSQSDNFDFNRINLFRRKKEYTYSFNEEELEKQIECYMEAKCVDSKYTVPYWHEEKVYGVEIYNYVISIFQNEEYLIRDKRMLYIFWEHKRCMQMRIEYMINQGIIEKNDVLLSLFRIVEKKAEQLKLLQLKMCMVNDFSISIRIANGLKDLRDLEQKSMCQLLNVLKKI